jgi:ribosomal protein S18 acetylase RimI-like enzyme
MEDVHDRLNPFVPYRREKSNPNVVNWVARSGQRLAGFIQYVYHPASHAPWTGHWLFSLHVWTRYRGMGLGTKLTYRVIEEAMGRGADELRLVVNDDNQRAIRLYRGMGFEAVIIPGLEPLFEKEKMNTGKRRIVMKKQIGVIS